jgi:hypothetical protein
MGYAVQAINWMAENIHYAKVAWKALQLGAQLALTGAVDLAALLVQGFEAAIEGIASGFNWLWSRTQQGLTETISWLITKIADFMSWMDSSLPASMQTGLGKVAQDFATTYEQIAEESRRSMEAQEWKVDLNMGGQTSREFADAMLDQARIATDDFWQFVEAGPDVAKMQEAVAATVEGTAAEAAKAMESPLGTGAGGGKSTLSVGALDRGSAAAMSAIVGTQKSLSLDQQNLEAQKRHSSLLDRIERNTRTPLIPAGL